ncbi:hypothetical protein [Stenotrophomonas sp.]|uniref:hypothetical protein n=1 Tax=Stenotrophomonas sp. TaxID=69392 RepID=UPI0028AB468B|nr:hypothetical protein [Stenotrophomonas sp.]
MSEPLVPTRLDVLVLALVRKTTSMHRVVEEGFTPGQVARALLSLEDQGLIIDADTGLRLSDLGQAVLDAGNVIIDPSEWISPLKGAKISKEISVCDIFLPDDHHGLD